MQNATLCSKMLHLPMGDTIRKALFSRQKKFFSFGTVYALYIGIEIGNLDSGESENGKSR